MASVSGLRAGVAWKDRTMTERQKHSRPRVAVARTSMFAEQKSRHDASVEPMGLSVSLLRPGDRAPLRAARPMIILPLHAGVAEVQLRGAALLVERASLMVLAGSTRATVEAKSPSVQVCTLSVGDGLAEAVVNTYKGEIDAARLEKYLATSQRLPRTNWMNEICHRYVFERTVCKKSETDATRFLEVEIVKEFYFLCHERNTERDRASLIEAHSPLVERAVRVIEQRLFEPDVLATLAEGCGASASTILRVFKREFGETPLAHVRARRLDESRLLLKSNKYTISEVASMVGYQNFSAFSHAFRARFGCRPSALRSTREGRS